MIKFLFDIFLKCQIAEKKEKIPHLSKFRHFCMNKERIPFIAIEQKSVSQALCNMLNITVRWCCIETRKSFYEAELSLFLLTGILEVLSGFPYHG